VRLARRSIPTSSTSTTPGSIIATNGGKVVLDGVDINGDGHINVSNGGVLAFLNPEKERSNVASVAERSQHLDLGGQTATTLAFDPVKTEIKSVISSFARTDLINLQNYKGRTQDHAYCLCHAGRFARPRTAVNRQTASMH
jgi:hypothetical protein